MTILLSLLVIAVLVTLWVIDGLIDRVKAAEFQAQHDGYRIRHLEDACGIGRSEPDAFDLDRHVRLVVANSLRGSADALDPPDEDADADEDEPTDDDDEDEDEDAE